MKSSPLPMPEYSMFVFVILWAVLSSSTVGALNALQLRGSTTIGKRRVSITERVLVLLQNVEAFAVPVQGYDGLIALWL